MAFLNDPASVNRLESSTAPSMCMDYVYTWPCGHEERLGSQECLFADEHDLHSWLPFHQTFPLQTSHIHILIKSRLRSHSPSPGLGGSGLRMPDLPSGDPPGANVLPSLGGIAKLWSDFRPATATRHLLAVRYSCPPSAGLGAARDGRAGTTSGPRSDQNADPSGDQASGTYTGQDKSRCSKSPAVVFIGPEPGDGVPGRVRAGGCLAT